MNGDEGSTLGQRARTAVAWNTGFQVFWDLLQLGLSLILVRLLPPVVYGEFNLLNAVLAFLTALSSRSFVAHLLQARQERDVHVQDQFTAGAVIQFLVFLATNGVALYMRRLPEYASLAPVVHVMSLIFLVDLPSQIRTRMLERQLAWRRFRLLHASGLITAALASIAMAVAGFGVYALIVPLLIVPTVYALDLFLVARWRPTWAFSWRNYRDAWRFGTARIASDGLMTSAMLLESAWLSRHIGFASLGILGRAVGLAQLSCQRAATLLLGSLYPVLTKVEPGTDAYRRVSALVLRAVAWFVIPMAGILSIAAWPVVRILYGTVWLPSVEFVPFAMAIGAAYALAQTSYQLLLAHGDERLCLRADALRTAGTTAGLVLLLPVGLKAYLIGATCVHLFVLAATSRWLARRQALAVGGVVDAIVPAIVAAATALAIVAAGWSSVRPESLVSPLLAAAAFALVYVVILRVAFGRQLRELVSYLPQRRHIGRLLWLREAAV